MHLLTGGPAWEERRNKPKPTGFTKGQKVARKPLLQALAQLDEAVRLRDWSRARLARAAAWNEVEKLADDLTREERKRLWKYKQQILAGEAQDRQRRERA